jgi:general secretion pathway protein A
MEAVHRLSYFLQDGFLGFALVTGEVGCGKTLMSRILQTRLARGSIHVILFDCTIWSFEEYLRDMLQALRHRPGTQWMAEEYGDLLDLGEYELMRRLRRTMRKVSRPGRPVVVIFDEAQQLGLQHMYRVKDLNNVFMNDDTPFCPILMGQTDLEEIVRANEPLDQRIGIRCRLERLRAEEVAAYVDHRLRRAGAGRHALFTDRAKQALYDETEGVPRLINRVCQVAMNWSFANGEDVVDEEHIRHTSCDMLAR